MKKIVMFLIALSTAAISHAAPLAPTEDKITPDFVDQAIRLADTQKDSVRRKVTVVVTDLGLSTDMSPRSTVYLTYNSNAEMGNLSASFLVANDVFHGLEAKRVAPGIFEISYVTYRDEGGMLKVTKTIDATELYVQDHKMRNACGNDFCDGQINASIDVKETAKKAAR
ncbi:hypothetical protein [Bdellovibrio sp. HCB288]|uniref:hypothetical protein n=1 Tax=Bdellovibrio sp. HCB288 TaxID=3394355 RepID=UPI0039B60779